MSTKCHPPVRHETAPSHSPGERTPSMTGAFAARGAFTIHADVLRGVNTHHKIEALFKALALALRRACRVEGQDLPSTKGTLTE